MRYLSLFVFFIVIFIGSLLTWMGASRIADFRNGHVAIAKETTTSVNESITRFISERRRFVNVFTTAHRDLLTNLVTEPDNEKFHEEIVDKLALFFPHHFAYTLVNQTGEPLFEDFDGLIGMQCMEDIHTFAASKNHLPKVHPNSEMYHFDIMVPFAANGKDYIFFLSFDADLLAEILQNSTVPDHELYLILPLQKRKLIEVTTKGSRVHLNRNDFRMTAHEEQRILHNKKIEGTGWEILDLHEKDLISTYNRKVYLTSGLLLSIFLLVSLLWYRHIRLAEQIRIEADNHKTEFLSTVSHELRTPLTAIKGSIGLIAGNINNDLSEHTLKLSQLALTNTERLISIVNDLLDIQKIEAGKLKLELRKANLTDLVQQSIESIEDYGRQFNVKFQLMDLRPNSIVNVDGNRFIQVMHNLMSNAAKYGGKNDTVEITITPHQNHVRVSVTDHGGGIPEDFKDKVFKKFAQENTSRKGNSQVESTGLGLHIVKQLIEKMDGEINFYSSDKGTTFFIDLQVVEV